MFDFDNPKLIIHRPILVLVHQLQDLKRSLFAFFFCVPTSLLALLLLFLLAYNGVSVFYIHVPFLAKFPPQPANFSRQNPVLKFSSSSSSSKLSSSVMYVVREENSPMFLKTHFPAFQNYNNFPLKPTPKRVSKFRISKRVKKTKRKVRRLSSETQNQNQFFTARLREFFFGSRKCKPRFFMTWISSLDSFGERELFAVESLFKSHPNACLAIVSKIMDSEKGNVLLKPFSDSGFRVLAISPDYDSVLKNTPAESWFSRLRKGNVNPGEISLCQNLSNLLRLALLYKFGGIYTDTDMIFVNSFSKLRNVIGAQTVDLETGHWSRLNNAVLVFDKNHPLLLMFIKEFALTFDGNKWGHNGPYLVSRVVKRLRENPGFNFTVLPPHAFYPVDWSRIRSLFRNAGDELHSKWMIGKMKHVRTKSFAVHLWNRQSKRLKVEEGSIIDHLQKDFCIFCNSSSVSGL
ncbi:Uncharacterized protein L484_012116 [Morus notabilis]|uniref:Alpha 1,4-glycosyltransferase domain-containing protein n=1 Tax=Morus notabilis TaxID=981085 RepID=W9S212_9ROSA|nr:lactosylceramide 4-alpha-galactosyltransferase [Morus notabilis]EXB82803.1 Uncharacterized protein L484_012116 [Morus notabilis]